MSNGRVARPGKRARGFSRIGLLLAAGGALLVAILTVQMILAPDGSGRRSAIPVPEIVYMSPSGNPTTCHRGEPTRPCSNFDQADAVAHPGDTVQVAAGTYTGSIQKYDYTEGIFHSTPVEYECAPGAAPGSVTFDSPGFLIGPGGGNVLFDGTCFHFHELTIGLRGYSGPGNRVSNVTVNGAHLDSTDIVGVDRLVVENSQIGPIDACFGDLTTAAANGAPPSAVCDPSNPVEAYWSTVGGTLDIQVEPFVHNNGPDLATNVTFNNDLFDGMQTKWPTVFHQGGLLVWGTTHLTIEHSTFENNAIYNVEFGDGANYATVLLDNTFGPAFYTIADGSPVSRLPARQCQDGLDAAGGYFDSDLVEGNQWAQCMNIGLGGSYSNTKVIGNTIGLYANCPTTPGVTYSNNTTEGRPVCH